MSAFIEGVIDYLDPELCILENGGIGYNINISARTMQQLPGIGESVRLYTYTSVREDALSLFGFLSRDDLEMFKRLISVSGVGPKNGLSILSILDADSIRFAILSGDAKSLAKAPGVGAKTAQRILLELKDKVSLSDDSIVSTLQHGGIAPDASMEGLSAEKQDAVAALVALGYSQTESRKAVASIKAEEGMDSGELLSAALKYLF